MCGIFGYVGSKDPVDVCIKGLSFLEYRGYDSSGIAGVHEQELHFCKEAGKIDNLKQAVSRLKQLRNAIAHTRWATHGKPSKENAHPHFDEKYHVAVVHNGIIENHATLRKFLLEKGISFRSETDTEIVAQLIAFYYTGDLAEAVAKALKHLQGFWAIAVVHKDHPDLIIASAQETPLSIGINSEGGEVFLSSDVNALHAPNLDILFLQDKEIATITPQGVKVYDSTYTPIEKATEKLLLEGQTISKNGYDHFMLKEIFDQPDTIRQAMHGRYLKEEGSAFFEGLEITQEKLDSIEQVLVLACGTSWHAGCIAADLIEEMVKIPARAEIASEFQYKNAVVLENTLVIALSQSGETFDTLAAVRTAQSKGATVLSFCNVNNSTLTRLADASILLRAGPEISVCSTKAFTSQLTALFLFILLMARSRGLSQEEGIFFLEKLQEIPSQVDILLRETEKLHYLADKYASYRHCFFLGRNYMFATCLEAALKLKEISYIDAIAYPSGEMKHGPIALVDETLPVIALCGNNKTLDKLLSNLMEVKSRGAPILAFAPIGTPEIADIADDVFWLPQTTDKLSTITYSVAGQILAYYIALRKGYNIDQPRNLAKSVTVE